MGYPFYNFVRIVGSTAFFVSASPVILHVERTRRKGPFILAATHQSPYDVALLIRHSLRPLDFVSIVEVFRKPLVAWFFGSMNAFPIDRSKRDSAGVRKMLDRLNQGRALAIFPEGNVRREEDSVVHGGKMRHGTGRLAEMSGAPVIPCVIINSIAYERFISWLPLRRVRYGMIFGQPLTIDPAKDKHEAALALENDLQNEMIRLHGELLERLSPTPAKSK